MRDKGKSYTYLVPQAKRIKFQLSQPVFLLTMEDLSEKIPSYLLNSPRLSSFFFFFSSRFFSCFFFFPLFFFVFVSDFFSSPRSLLQPPFLYRTPFAATFLSAFSFLQPPFLSHSFCSHLLVGLLLQLQKARLIPHGH